MLAFVLLLGIAGMGPASARPTGGFTDRSGTRTFDGWTVRLVKFDEEVHSVPALNQSPWTREGFLSLGGRLEISGTGKSPVTAAALSTGFQVACNTDVSSGVQLGVTFGPTAQMSISYPPAVVLGAQIR